MMKGTNLGKAFGDLTQPLTHGKHSVTRNRSKETSQDAQSFLCGFTRGRASRVQEAAWVRELRVVIRQRIGFDVAIRIWL